MQDRPETVIPIDTQRSRYAQLALNLAYRPWFYWKYGLLNQLLSIKTLRRQTASKACDAVLGLGEQTYDAGVPTFVYQDRNLALAASHLDVLDIRFLVKTPMTAERLRKLADRQLERYDHLSGVMAMSEWFASEVASQGISRDSVHVVGAGINSASTTLAGPMEANDRNRLLFVGSDFHRKAGVDVLEAVRLLRSEGGLPLTLTVIGPRQWPCPGSPPTWVHFMGPTTPDVVATILPKHDLFVLPSHFEPYGIAFLEAQAAGVPCVARRAFAMPELVPENRGGLLVERNDGPEALAEAIARALADDSLYDGMQQRSLEVRKDYSWEAVAARIMAVIFKELGIATHESSV